MQALGARAACNAIANGVPRWIATTADEESGQADELIHREIGLPIARLSVPKERAVWQAEFTRGHNDEIMRALRVGEISVDFRPLLMTRDEVENTFIAHPIGKLSLDQPRIEDPTGRFVLSLKTTKLRNRNAAACEKTEPTIWIAYDVPPAGEPNPRFGVYAGPLDLALGREGRVLLVKTECLYLAYDVETTQVLNRYLIR